jgi:hypothetical protein
MAELLSVHCAQGRLTITESHIIVERGNLRSAMMPRTSFTGIDVKMMYWIPIPGMTRYKLTFHGMGAERIKASALTRKTVSQIKAILTGRG